MPCQCPTACKVCILPVIGTLVGLVGIAQLIGGAVILAESDNWAPDKIFEEFADGCQVRSITYHNYEQDDECIDTYRYEFCLPDWSESDLEESSGTDPRRALQSVENLSLIHI